MGVVKFHAVKPRCARPRRRIGENCRQRLWQFRDVRQMSVRHAFAIAESQRFQFPFVQHAGDQLVRRNLQKSTYRNFAGTEPVIIAG